MAVANSSIEWTDSTWSPVTGCTKVSPGCDHCYAERITERFHGPGSFTRVVLHPDRLALPLRWRKPQRIFVNSMSDLFHAEIPDAFIAQVFAVMAAAPHHTFQILTKRHARMRSLLMGAKINGFQSTMAEFGLRDYGLRGLIEWPLPNVWLGVSVEDQKWADIRVPALLDTPAAVRWISAEPLLGSLDLRRWLSAQETQRLGGDLTLDWIVTGGESGPGARPMQLDWARLLRDQCTTSGVPFLFKQWGAWRPVNIGVGVLLGRQRYGEPVDDGIHSQLPWRRIYERVGKKAAGRMLDGRTWDEYPERMLAS